MEHATLIPSYWMVFTFSLCAVWECLTFWHQVIFPFLLAVLQIQEPKMIPEHCFWLDIHPKYLNISEIYMLLFHPPSPQLPLAPTGGLRVRAVRQIIYIMYTCRQKLIEFKLTPCWMQVLEETGFDFSKLLNKEEYIEMIFGQQRVRLYIVTGVKEDTAFAPLTKKEISVC